MPAKYIYTALSLLIYLQGIGIGICIDDWHNAKSTQKLLIGFHQAKAAFPRSAIASAQTVHEKVMLELRSQLKKYGNALRFEYVGSSYEGIKVGSTDMEFDVMVVLPGGENLKDEIIRPGWAKLRAVTNLQAFSHIPHAPECLEPTRATSHFFGTLRKALNDMPEYKERIKLRQHGPAIQMDVYTNRVSREILYTVDMVPAYQLGDQTKAKDGIYYVAKPFKGDESDGKSWRRSFGLLEKDRLRDIDHGDKCRKQCIRIFKVMRDHEPGLNAIVSYWLKTSIFNLQTEQPELEWDIKNLGVRFFDMMSYLADALDEGTLRHHFLPEVNLLEDLELLHRINLAARVRRLIEDEDKFTSLLNKILLGRKGSKDEL